MVLHEPCCYHGYHTQQICTVWCNDVVITYWGWFCGRYTTWACWVLLCMYIYMLHFGHLGKGTCTSQFVCVASQPVTHAGRQAGRQTDRQTDRQTGKGCALHTKPNQSRHLPSCIIHVWVSIWVAIYPLAQPEGLDGGFPEVTSHHFPYSGEGEVS
jgi:hypothetical protein